MLDDEQLKEWRETTEAAATAAVSEDGITCVDKNGFRVYFDADSLVRAERLLDLYRVARTALPALLDEVARLREQLRLANIDAVNAEVDELCKELTALRSKP